MSHIESGRPKAQAGPILAKIICGLGVLVAIIGVSIYAVTSKQLSDQKITVAAVTAQDPGSLAGKPVAGPFTALAQVNAIKHHIAEATGGKTYGELGSVASNDGLTYSEDVTAAKSSDGHAHKAGDVLSSVDAKLYAARATAETGSMLQASILVSVIAFGIGAMITGFGVIFFLLGLAIILTGRRPAAHSLPADLETARVDH
ncbi:MAG: hypothetical protein LBV30_08950 [Propionibacteriaceae bacterium]|jgi:hypothetical protein|nr:hypothetical protein [Propionibacteriaceae bacterium]